MDDKIIDRINGCEQTIKDLLWEYQMKNLEEKIADARKRKKSITERHGVPLGKESKIRKRGLYS